MLELREVEVPAPGENEVLVRVRASSVNPADWYLVRGKPFLVRLAGSGFLRPRSEMVGADVAGVVEATGPGVQQLRPGDAVMGIGGGTFAEFVNVRESGLVPKPSSFSFEEAASAPLAGLTALQALRTQGNLQRGQRVLIHGASGGVGTFAIQIAKALGAEVTAVCSTGKVDLARSLGAVRVIDYTKQDFAAEDARYDLVVVVNGHRPIRQYRRALQPSGTCVLVGGSISQVLRGLLVARFTSRSGPRRLRTFIMRPNPEDLGLLRGLMDGGQVKPVLDRSFPLPDVAQALQYLRDGHVRGKVAVTV